MDQPLFSCTKCFKTFPKSDMSKSGETCKLCNPNNSSFKQCEFCKSDFKNYIHGSICPRCQTQKYKYGDPKTCSICSLNLAFGNALICQRCQHYKTKFGDPTTCQSCKKICAFIKEEESRKKVNGQILCWVCTYEYKLAKNKENSLKSRKKPQESNLLRHSHSSHQSKSKSSNPKTDFHPTSHQAKQETAKKSEYTSDSLYNEHILTICQQQDEILFLKGQLSAKQAELIDKDRTIAELKSDIIDIERTHKTSLEEVQASGQLKIEQYIEKIQDYNATIRQLRLEKNNLSNNMKKKRSSSNLSELTRNPLRLPSRKSTSYLGKEEPPSESTQNNAPTTPNNSAAPSPKVNSDEPSSTMTTTSTTAREETLKSGNDQANEPDELPKTDSEKQMKEKEENLENSDKLVIDDREKTDTDANRDEKELIPRKKIRLIDSSDESETED